MAQQFKTNATFDEDFDSVPSIPVGQLATAVPTASGESTHSSSLCKYLYSPMCVRACVRVHACTPCACVVPLNVRKGIRSFGTRIRGDSELSCGCWELSPDPL